MQDRTLFDLYQKILKERDPDKLSNLVAELLKPLTQANPNASVKAKAKENLGKSAGAS